MPMWPEADVRNEFANPDVQKKFGYLGLYCDFEEKSEGE